MEQITPRRSEGSSPAAGRLGFRRLEYVRVVLHDGTVDAEAVGIVHRLPVALPISLATATRLVRDGVRLVVDDGRAHRSVA